MARQVTPEGSPKEEKSASVSDTRSVFHRAKLRMLLGRRSRLSMRLPDAEMVVCVRDEFIPLSCGRERQALADRRYPNPNPD